MARSSCELAAGGGRDGAPDWTGGAPAPGGSGGSVAKTAANSATESARAH
jgi:hypothetical protein